MLKVFHLKHNFLVLFCYIVDLIVCFFLGATVNDVVTSNGSVHSTTTLVKNNQRKLDKVDREKSCTDSEHKSINNNKSFSHANGDINTELEFIERIG